MSNPAPLPNGPYYVALHADAPGATQDVAECAYDGYERRPTLLMYDENDRGSVRPVAHVQFGARRDDGPSVVARFVSLGDAAGRVLRAAPLGRELTIDRNIIPIVLDSYRLAP